MKKYIGFSIIALGLTLTSCDDWLDKLPDNRMELQTPSDVSNLLVSAYPSAHPAYLLEMYSDNTDDCVNPSWSEASRFQAQAYKWEDITETGEDESPQELWNKHYIAIASANAAIDLIEGKGSPAEYSEQLGEALLCRAYAMFQLSTVFCKAYNPATASTDLGLPYPTHPEKVVGTVYTRGTMEDLYGQIDKDLQRGLPLVSSNYSKPKFHFNTDAAKAFAARFYLYKGDFAKAITYATEVLGADPTAKARDWDAYSALNMNDQIRPEAWVSADEKCNFLLQTVYSEWGAISGPYLYGEKYAHSYRITYDEDIASKGPFGAANSTFKQRVWSNTALAKLFHRKVPYEFEYTDLQAGIGFAHAEYAVFTTEQLLLERAEAYALSGELQKAVDDYNTIMKIYQKYPKTFTLKQIVDFYNGVNYYTPKKATVKKHFVKPVYTIDAEGSDQEALLQAILHLRRIMEVGEGYRMQDVKRYGIVIYRRQTNTSYTISAVTDSLTVDDPRRAIQLPQDVITSGLEPNDRITVKDQGGNIMQDSGFIYEIKK
ncbi:RagB/SusD family nutrient uptake outer membrane protein [Prevotella sp. P4-119]|uniref:RagB/SusD family nutrient uptake outer membrane protein n=1 Tax=Prevotella sp. P4-119 TaxID=2024218 RepID=UPI000B9638EB|nr:RagB/SusD family nutrient uptake outer membrane protein [Prevotella sp. P4-119]OYP44208.1 carbohydrate-binding protein [Prevotella sp. P4-119]